MNTRILKTLRRVLCLVLVLGMLPLAALADGISSGTPDGTPPVLTSLSLSAVSVVPGGEIEVTAAATDDVSGVSRVYVYFSCEETGKSLSCSLYSTYWDSNEFEDLPYPDGKFHGFLEVGQYLEAGTFVLREISVYDRAGNGRSYYVSYDPDWSDPEDGPIPDFVTHRQITVTNPGTPDGTPPVLSELTLATTTIAAPGEIEVTAAATDDVSGVSRVYVYFSCEETGKSLSCSLYSTYWDSNEFEDLPYPDGKFHGFLEVGQYLEAGTFVLREISVYDRAGNGRSYYVSYDPDWSDPEDGPIPDFVTQRQITVTNPGTPDGTPPVLSELTLATTTIAAPGEIEVTAAATDDVSGVSRVYVYFSCEETGKSLSCSLFSTYWDSNEFEDLPYPDGKFHGFLEVGQYLEAGIFVLREISVYDRAGNGRSYYVSYDPDWSDPEDGPIPGFVTQRQIQVLNAVPDVTTSLGNSQFVNQLQGAKEDAYIVADYSGKATMPADAFSAIAGTDKTLDLVSEGITWRFNGNDITNDIKPIDLQVEIKPVEEHPSEAAKDIQAALENQAAVVMQFPENGQLPGKATIQVKVDYAMREYLGGERNLCVYYYNNQTGELELIAKDLVVINDTFVEFPITHCSNYVLTMGDGIFPFIDVPNGAWYLQPVFWAVSKGITNGIDATHFDPNGTCTRAQIVTFLWRANGSPKASGTTTPFTDVPANAWYADAVLWAVEKGITSGTSATTFSPDAGCTRGQVATFLWRSQGQLASGANNIFMDIVPGSYYYNAVLWAVANGITHGMGDGTFAPDATCTRGQIVTFLYRAMA